MNTFGYVYANPLIHADPFGLAVKCKTILKLPYNDIQACTKDDSTPSEQDAKDAKRMSNKELDQTYKNNGYKDAHYMEIDLQPDSKYDILTNKHGNMYVALGRARAFRNIWI